MCSEWRSSFSVFMKDMGPRPSKFHSIERRNNDGNYEPSNCFWATKKQQQNNTSHNLTIIVDGNKTTVGELSDQYGITKCALYRRIKRGVSKEELLTKGRLEIIKSKVKKKQFLINYKLLGSIKLAQIKTKVGLSACSTWRRNDAEFNKQFIKVKSSL